MPKVYVTSLTRMRPVFHQDPQCMLLVRAQRRWPDSAVCEVDVSDLAERDGRPCCGCYPDAPRVRVRRALCSLCSPERRSPCAHNGGVLVEIEVKGCWKPGGHVWDPDRVRVMRRYVWPENVFKHRVVLVPGVV